MANIKKATILLEKGKRQNFDEGTLQFYLTFWVHNLYTYIYIIFRIYSSFSYMRGAYRMPDMTTSDFRRNILPKFLRKEQNSRKLFFVEISVKAN